jgi:hypothetical protein
MNLYCIETIFKQRVYVVARTMGSAESIFIKDHSSESIRSITQIDDPVYVQETASEEA